MSVINRMLADLERRGAPGARRLGAAGPSGQRREGGPRRRRVLARLAPVLLLAALIVVAALLWHRQWPEIRRWASAGIEPAPAGNAGAESPSKPAAPDVTRFRFETDDGATRLVVAFDGPLPEAPGYGRSGDRLGLRLPARWDATPLPSPPAGQSVFRGVMLAARGDASTRLRITVDPDARFDLAHDDSRLVLTGRLPTASAEPETADPGAKTTDAQVAANSNEAPAAEAAPAANGKPDANSAGDPGGTEASDSTAAQAGSQRDAGEGVASPETGGNDRDAVASPSSADTTTADADGRVNTRDDAATGTAGTVRKSAPDVSPAERARRLESAARQALDNGDVARARQRLVAALDQDPDRHSARDLLVALYLRRGDAAAARNLLAEGVARAPRRTAYARPFARLLVDAGDLERAYRVLERAAPAAADDAGYHGLMAAVAQRLGRHEEAASAYTRALELDGDRGVWWMGLGISLRETDHPSEALAAFREARSSGDLNKRLERWVQQQIEALSDSVR